MTTYRLYLESGPRQRKTMVHVLDLLGCIARGPTTEAALAAAPAAIRAYLRFLRSVGETASPDASFSTEIAAHVMEGSWLAEGDPQPGFAPDFQPLEPGELALYLRRLEGLRAALLAEVRGATIADLLAEPPGGGRSLYDILRHTASAQAEYLRMTVGKVPGLSEARKAVEQGPEEIAARLSAVWEICLRRLGELSETERNQLVPHGQTVWTARRGLRRSLEHPWEHLQEIRDRKELNQK